MDRERGWVGVAGEEREGKADKRVSEADREGRRGSLICLSQFSTEELQGHRLSQRKFPGIPILIDDVWVQALKL